MRYLNSRDKFLKNLKDSDLKINEAFDMSGQGPFGNDIPWGDSLVGRLVNSIRRKISVGVNLVRIQPVIMRLKMEMENLRQSATIRELSEEDRKKIAMVIICNQIRILKLAIVNKASYGSDEDGDAMVNISDDTMTEMKDENYLKEVESILTDVRETIGQITDDWGKIDGYEELVKVLKELAEFISLLKFEQKENAQSEGSGDKEEPTSEISDYISNLKSIAQIVIEWDSLKRKKSEEFKKGAVSTGSSALTPSESEKDKEKNLIGTLTTDSYHINETNTDQPITVAIKKLYDTLKQISPQDLITDMNSLLDTSQEKYSLPISKIYKYVKLKMGIKESYLIKEDLNLILSKDKTVGDLIISLWQVSKTKMDGSFEGISDNMKKYISEFNSSMTKCLSQKNKTNESKILNYDSFREEYLINESKLGEFLGKTWAKIKQFFSDEENLKDKEKDLNDNENPAKVDDPNKLKVTKNTEQRLLQFYWNDIYTNRISKIIATDAEYKKLREEVDKIEEPETDSLIIGMDPLIGIVKCFNRAYKLHTTPVIPGGRSGGKVSNKTFLEYTSFGGGTPETAGKDGGPYRNNRIFNMWENAVLEVMRDKENLKIFNVGTILNLGEGKIKKEAGPALRRFMVDMLDGETLYKGKDGLTSKDGGAQKEILNKYFDIPIEDIKSSDLAFDGTKELDANSSLQKDIKTSKVEFKEGNIDKIKDPKEFLKMIFELDVEMQKPADYKEEDPEIETKKRYFLPLQIDSDFYYVVFSKNFSNISKYIENDYGKRDNPMTVSFIPPSLKSQQESEIFVTKMKPQNFKKMITKGQIINITGQSLSKGEDKEIGKQTCKDVNFLYTKEGDEEPTIYKIQKYNFSGSKGFELERLKSQPRPESK